MQEEQFDVVIVGAGLGGLLTGVILAKEGLKVCILEKNRQIGGCLQTFAFQKKVFDSSVHYIGGLSQGHSLHKIFQYAGIMDDLPLQHLDANGFDEILFADDPNVYPIARRDHFVDALLPFFPNEKQALLDYLDLIDQVTGEFPLYRLSAGAPDGKGKVIGLELIQTLRSITQDEKLIQVLAGNNLLYAGVEGHTPFFVHALSMDSYLHSAAKVLPGSSQISKLLWKQMQQNRGIIHRNTEVVSLVLKEGLISHALSTDGRSFYAKHFIGAIHPLIIAALCADKAFRPLARERIQSLQSSPSAIMLNLVLKPGTVIYPHRNRYWHPSGVVMAKQDNAEDIEWPDTMALFYTEDPAHPGYSESLSILLYAECKEFETWSGTTNVLGTANPRNPEYVSRKKEITAQLLQKVFRRFPELQGQILGNCMATPLSYRDYTANPEGTMYGALKDAHFPAQAQLSPRTRIPNLLLTGQHVNLHGVVGVSMTALATCGALLGLDNLLAKIRDAN